MLNYNNNNSSNNLETKFPKCNCKFRIIQIHFNNNSSSNKVML